MQVTEFCNKVKLCLPNIKYSIIGEISQPKLSHGHLYFNIKDESSNIKCIIWKNKLDKIKYEINDGDKLTIEIKLDFYSFTGSLNFIVDNVINNEGTGNLQKKYNEIKNNFELKGYFDSKNKLQLPSVIKNILIITSETGAAIKDFLFNLKNNNSKINYTIIDVPVQGYDCHNIISKKLEDIYNDILVVNDIPIVDHKIDAIIITRGGGSFQDLFGFSESELIESVFKFKKYPIISAIGHQIDNPLLDLVADISCPTPSLAAQFLIDHNKNFINKLCEIKFDFYNKIKTNFFSEEKRLNEIKNKLKIDIDNLSKIINGYKNIIEKDLLSKKEEIKLIKNKINFNIEGIHIFKEDIEILEPKFLTINGEYNLLWNNKKFKINILSCE